MIKIREFISKLLGAKNSIQKFGQELPSEEQAICYITETINYLKGTS